MRLATQMIAGFMVIALLLTGVALVSMFMADNMADSRMKVEDEYEKQTLIYQYSINLFHEYQLAIVYILDPDSSESDERVELKELYCDENKVLFSELLKDSEDEDYYSAMSEINDILLEMDDIFENFVDNPVSNMDEKHTLVGILDSQLNFIITGTGADDSAGFDYVNQMIAQEIEQANEELANSQELLNLTNLLGILTAVCVSIILGVATTKSISTPIRKLTEASSEVIEGNLDVFVEEEGQYELKELAHTFNQMIGNLNKEIRSREETEKKLLDEHMRSEFYNDLLSHDIRNYNQGVLSNLELLLLSIEGQEKNRKYIQNALRQVASSSNLITNLKKLDGLKHHETDLRNIDIRPIFQEAVDMVKAQFPEKQLEIVSNIVEGEYRIQANELLIDVFVNLLNNATKFDRHQVVRIDIDITQYSNNLWKIEIKDKCVNIDDTRKAVIFDRIKMGSPSVSGTGIGLTLVKKIITNFGGRIWVEDRSEGERGNNFVLIIPKGG